MKPKNEDDREFRASVARMYKRFVLDCISDLGYAVAMDFSQKPHLYVKVDAIADTLSQLQSEINTSSNLPGKDTRARLYQPVWGNWENDKTGKDNAPFKTLRLKLFQAAASYAENAQPFRFAALRIDVINAIAAPRDHFEGLNGSSLKQTYRRTADIFELSQKIIKHEKIMRRFGVDGEINDESWPLSNSNSVGTKLIHEMSRNLEGIPGGVIAREEFVTMQRIAQRGAEALVELLDPTLDDIPDDVDEKHPSILRLNKFIGNLYAWGRDIGAIGNARNVLSVIQKS